MEAYSGLATRPSTSTVSTGRCLHHKAKLRNETQTSAVNDVYCFLSGSMLYRFARVGGSGRAPQEVEDGTQRGN
jgi:hypothetical protein